MKQGKICARVLPRAVLLLLLAGPGCATLTGSAGDQKVKIDSTPPGASVVVDGKLRGATPTVVQLDDKVEHQVQLAYPGYETAQVALRPKLNPWVFGNLVLGGPVGLLVDICTDSVYELTPDTLQITLRSQTDPAGSHAAPSLTQGAPPGR